MDGWISRAMHPPGWQWHHGDSQESGTACHTRDEISVSRYCMFYQNDDGGYRSNINFNVGQFRGSIKPIAICVGNFQVRPARHKYRA